MMPFVNQNKDIPFMFPAFNKLKASFQDKPLLFWISGKCPEWESALISYKGLDVLCIVI